MEKLSPMTVNRHHHSYLKLLLLAACMVLAVFLWEGNIGFDFADEGFLWYGAQRVLVGEVPIRDFMAYDPGRYYWSAGFMRLWHDNGIMVLRGSVAVFQTLGLYVGLCLIASTLTNTISNKQNRLYLLLSAFILVAWMYPRHKLFDISLSVFLIGILSLLIQKPTQLRYFVTGFFIGLVAIFGRNHAMYGFIGSLGVILWLNIKPIEGPGFVKGVSLWLVGALVGFIPIILMAILAPGFGSAFGDGLRFLFESKATNLPLPIPWPWQVNFTEMALNDAIQKMLVGVFFIGLLFFAVCAIIYVVWSKFQGRRVSSVLVAAAFLALPYAQYAYSRADVGHLALSIFPLLMGLLVLLANASAKFKWPLIVLLSVSSLWVMLPVQPGWQCHLSQQCRSVVVSHNVLQVNPLVVDEIDLFRHLTDDYAGHNSAFLAESYWPGAYALLQRKAPTWELCALFARSAHFEQLEIQRLQQAKPQFALVNNAPLDGDVNKCFQKTHPIIYRYIQEHFERLPNAANMTFELYKIKPVVASS